MLSYRENLLKIKIMLFPLLQVENEYGSYFACDKVYLELLQSFYREYLSDDIVLFSVDDGFREKELKCGSLPSIFKTVDFGPTKDVLHGFDILKKLQPKGPSVCFYSHFHWKFAKMLMCQFPSSFDACCLL